MGQIVVTYSLGLNFPIDNDNTEEHVVCNLWTRSYQILQF